MAEPRRRAPGADPVTAGPRRVRWAVAGLALVVAAAGCAHPAAIKRMSKEQEALLAGFRTALEDVRTSVRTAFDESIADYRVARLRAFLDAERRQVAAQILDCLGGGRAECQGKSARVLLAEASRYLAEAELTLFTADYCSAAWATLKKDWMRRPGEQCLGEPARFVADLQAGRDQVDAALRRLGAQIVAVERGHAIIDKFLQIRVEITTEDVDAARSAIDKATKAVVDARETLQALARERGGG